MAKKSSEFPSVDDLIVGTVHTVTSHGVYVRLDEFVNKEGFVHISEIASTWIRNIRNHVREKQKIVAKVLRVAEEKGHVDLSIRRVSDFLRKNKLQMWKRGQKAEKLLELAAQKLNKTLEEAYNEAGWKMEDGFGEIYAGFEEALEKGMDPLIEKAGLSEEWAKVLAELSEAYVVLPKVKISGTIDLQCLAPNGVDIIKKALLSGLRKAKKNKEAKVDIYLVGSPNWKILIEAGDYKIAEKVMDETVATIVKSIEKNDGEATFRRE